MAPVLANSQLNEAFNAGVPRDFVASFNRVYVARLFPPSWHQLTLHSGWMDGTAGGPPAGMFDTEELSPTWCCNPQFRVTVRKPAELLLCLSQRDPQVRTDHCCPNSPLDRSPELRGTACLRWWRSNATGKRNV